VLVSDRPVFAARRTEIHREGKIPPPQKSLFRVSTLVLLSIFYNLVPVALGMQGFAVFVGRDTGFFQSDGLVANTADEANDLALLSLRRREKFARSRARPACTHAHQTDAGLPAQPPLTGMQKT
jgi:hypothetical protein